MFASMTQSLRRKLIVLITTVASLSVLTGCMGLCTYQWLRARATLRSDSNMLAQMIADNSAAALLFNDARAATETLAGLREDTRVQQACLFNKEGQAIATFRASTEGPGACPAVARIRSEFTWRHLYVRREVSTQQEPVGVLYLKISLAEMYSVLLHFGEVAAFAVICATFFASVLSSLTERWISGPILHLTEVALQISRSGDYDVRATQVSSDEVGLLIEQFNVMLDRIWQREKELRHASEVLEAKVQERTYDLRCEIVERKLIEQHLEQARVKAEESSRAKSNFLANMSHELRTPLNAIIGYSEMLCEDAEDAGQRTMTSDLKKILSSARHLLGVISDVLDVSKIEAGQMKVFVEPVSVRSLLDDVLPTAEVLAAQKKNLLEIHEAPNAVVRVDPLRFRQCLLNLISNACKFTHNGKVTLDVQLQSRNDRTLTVWAVHDTGLGIASEDCDKLFKSFSQVDTSATRNHGGTGLGLAISQDLCKAMGGWIEVTSELGVGSVFSIVMPLPEGDPLEGSPVHGKDDLPLASGVFGTVFA